jgi:maltose O-acetyltransferase
MKKILIKNFGDIIIIIRSFQDYIFREWFMYIPFHIVRRFFVGHTVKSFGEGCSFMMGVEIRNGRNIILGRNCVVNKKVLLDGRGGIIRIGSNVDIAQETNIWTLQHDVHSDFHESKGGDVIIEDYVWVASRVTILPGVKIGKGAVIAANSVVTKDIDPMTINGGIPAKVIGIRNSKLKYTLYHAPWFQ